MFDFLKRKTEREVPPSSPLQQAQLWREARDGLVAPDWIFEEHDYAIGSMLASVADLMSRCALKEVNSIGVQKCLSSLPAEKAKAAIAAYCHSFVYRGIAMHWSHQVEVDDETHKIASFAARYVHALVGDPYSARDILGDAGLKKCTTNGQSDGLVVALSILKEKKAPSLLLEETLRELR